MRKLFLIIPAILLFATSCTERIDIELDESFTRLVVFGSISTDTASHFIELSTTSSYYFNEAPPPVSGATVVISDEEGNTESLAEVEPGKYSTSPTFFAIPGRIYTLRIELQEEINGYKTYLASSTVSPNYPIDSIGLVYQPDWGEDGFYEITCYYQDPPSTNFYMFNIFKNGELLTDTISNRLVTNDDFFNGNYTNGIGVGYLNQSKDREILRAGDLITFQACIISEEYYDFIVTLQTETGFQTPLFSGPPANVKSNLNNGAVGFFTAYGVSYSSKVFQP